jgi:hypothetical protein
VTAAARLNQTVKQVGPEVRLRRILRYILLHWVSLAAAPDNCCMGICTWCRTAA